ncbi:hypothetical protein, partial [Photorhabdus bodei]|uniref:hypothetical protein n=1 Tax=Photorhabdus bodei TaxID=2029681 RepID=UPI001E3CDFFC
GIIFSLLSIQITGCPKSVIEFNLMLEKVTSTLLRHPLYGGEQSRSCLHDRVNLIVAIFDLMRRLSW